MKTQIRICLTVEFKANFLIFPVFAATLETRRRLLDPAAGNTKSPESLNR
jgi:hypothetical protein